MVEAGHYERSWWVWGCVSLFQDGGVVDVLLSAESQARFNLLTQFTSLWPVSLSSLNLPTGIARKGLGKSVDSFVRLHIKNKS